MVVHVVGPLKEGVFFLSFPALKSSTEEQVTCKSPCNTKHLCPSKTLLLELTRNRRFGWQGFQVCRGEVSRQTIILHFHLTKVCPATYYEGCCFLYFFYKSALWFWALYRWSIKERGPQSQAVVDLDTLVMGLYWTPFMMNTYGNAVSELEFSNLQLKWNHNAKPKWHNQREITKVHETKSK